jgi:UDP-N-acetyl-D-glucosamine dehydrogenase
MVAPYDVIVPRVAVIGLGYVGLPFLLRCESQGIDVVGYDVDNKKVENLKNGKSPLEEEEIIEKLHEIDSELEVSTDPSVMEGSDYFVITVPTPVESKKPDLSYIKSATETVSGYLEQGSTLILESTVPPGSTEKILKPVIEEEGFNVGKDAHLAFCPERVDPGNPEWGVHNIPRVLGGCTDDCRDSAKELYSEVIEADVFDASSLEVAESSKVLENSFRDINIAFVNEVAKALGSLGIPAKEVIAAADTKPFGFMAHWPGCGVGGHCIPVDPYFLIRESKKNGFKPEFLSKARQVNDSMPSYAVEKVVKGLNSVKKPVNGTNIAVLGLAYKGGVSDTRRSPSYEIIKKLEDKGADVSTYDPHLPEESDLDSLEEVRDAECVVLATDHSEFDELGDMDFAGTQVLVDGKNMLDPGNIQCQYLSIGNVDEI